MSLSYLRRNLEDRREDARQAFGKEVMRVEGEATLAGALHGSRTFILNMQAGKGVLDQQVRSAIQFAFNLSGEPSAEVVDLVAGFGKAVLDDIAGAIRKKAELHDRAFGGGYMAIVDRQQPDLERKLAGLIDGFRHGMMGDERLKREPVVSITNNQTNSPGAVLQVGSNFNMSAFNQHHQSLVQEIERTLASPEFGALTAEQQDELRDIADVVKAEAGKATPDEGKLKRWGRKLVDFSGDVGLKVASGSIAGLLAKMFIG
ncbi:hypothetical protein GGD63_001056 [Bradyrhizobium sp. cir1]|uniref:hypothetical protein n=1 Tax=Bradyrhizobium sp. cir1 TaxID=1445730 RepID=UPI001605B7DC|nr:hypothetical protein [Bradyrhizobium sp. cir1]MBB4368277.1 hypothetical protein [Bradyrhizobium sp. cir1]